MTGLFRRGGFWWARLAVPVHLRDAAGRREFIQSTRTHDQVLAKVVASSLLAIWRRQLRQLESCPMSIDLIKLFDGAPALMAEGYLPLGIAADISGIGQATLLRAVAGKQMSLFCRVGPIPGYFVAEESLEFIDADLGRQGGLVVPNAADMPVDVARDTAIGVLQVSRGEEYASAVLANHLDLIDIVAFDAPGRPGWLFVPDAMISRTLQHLEVKAADVEAMRTKMALTVPLDRVAHAKEIERARMTSTPAAIGKHADKSFLEAVEAYCKSPTGLPADLASKSEQSQRKKGLMLFAEFMGDLPLREIDGDKLREFRDGPLRTLPAKVNALPKAYRRSSMKEMVDVIAAAGFDWPTMSVDMQHERMLWLSRLFAWLAKDWIAKDPSASLRGESGLTRAERKAAKREVGSDDEGREPFNVDKLKLIFGQRHFQTGKGDHIRKPSYWYGFEYWLPLMGLYAGLRIREASQLHLEDVKRVAGDAWCLDINEATADKSLKNENSRRMVPLHKMLIRLGFLDYCDRLRELGFRRVFPELTSAKSDAGYAKQSGRKMSEMLLALGMPRDSKHVFHCLRHNMNNALMRVPMSDLPYVDEDLKKFIRYTVMGHKPGDDVNVTHYTSTSVPEMRTLIDGVIYELPTIAKFDIDYAIAQVTVALGKKEGDRKGREDLGPLRLEG